MTKCKHCGHTRTAKARDMGRGYDEDYKPVVCDFCFATRCLSGVPNELTHDNRLAMHLSRQASFAHNETMAALELILGKTIS